MGAKWNTEEYAVDIIINKLESIKTTSGSGQVSFSGFHFQQDISIMRSTVIFSPNLPRTEQKRIISQSVFAAANQGKLTKELIIKEISKLESEYFQRPKKKFILATSISVERLSLRRVTNKAKITFSPVLPSYFDRTAILGLAKHTLFAKIPETYCAVRISIDARSEQEAAFSALDTIDFLRGIWNLCFNHTRLIAHSFGKRAPINSILLGPLHTLHEPSGKLATEQYWYETDYVEPVQCKNLNKNPARLLKFESLIRSRLFKKSKYVLELEDAIKHYTRALDNRDFNKAFIELWSVLEYLTCTQNQSYKVTIRRVSFLFHDKEYHHQVLTHLKNYRNQTIHRGYESDEIETLLYQLKFYVEELLLFHIGSVKNFSGIHDVGEFLDLPSDLPNLQNKIQLLKRALKFHR